MNKTHFLVGAVISGLMAGAALTPSQVLAEEAAAPAAKAADAKGDKGCNGDKGCKGHKKHKKHGEKEEKKEGAGEEPKAK